MLLNIVRGLLIGIANIIPGVSGGTFALILGIYDRLIKALSGITFGLFKNILSAGRFWQDLKAADIFFLIHILAGAVISIASLSWFIDGALRDYPAQTLAYFIGLIIPSISVPYRMIQKKSISGLVFVLAGIAAVVSVNNLKFASADISLPFVFFSGIIAISAMILPGISGSFVLLVLGVYEHIVSSIKSFTSTFSLESFVILAVFSSGCLAGLTGFARLMRLLLKKYTDRTLYFLIGLVAGSVAVLWPFKDYPAVTGQKIEIAVTTSANVMPGGLREVSIALFFLLLGFVCSFGLSYIANKKHN
ncbi:MAG: DUF368 domain-containing protein [Elusimicrobia bacterium]|nr:DUF368 domain-containing protein [Elusimicrobiota bacterium]